VILLTLTLAAAQQKGERLYVERNFFGVKEVSLDRDGRFRNLVHGNTNHGRQSTDPARAAEPVSYYHRTGPMAEVFTVCNSAQNSAGVGIIGLGTGSIAAFAQPGQQFTFYEIDPAIERIARDPRYFTFLSQSRGRCDVVLGDGRLTLARAPDGHFGIILLDAFSSDAIPTHLLSREAVRLYLSKLDETGVLLFHISNRYLNFKPMLARLAQEMNLTCLAREDTDISPQLAAEGKIGSRCVVMARRPEDLRGLDRRPGWAPMTIDPHCPVWTDQFCDVLSLFHFGRGTERKAN